MIPIPEEFARGVARAHGDAGRAWIDHLPDLVASICQEWNLLVDGTPMHGYLGLVVPVRRGDELCALKVSWIDESTAYEMTALSAWRGRGAVRLLAARPGVGAMLLERLNGEWSLRNVDVDEAVTVAGRLLRQLAVPSPNALPLLKDVAVRLSESLPERWERLARPMSRRLIDSARDLAVQIGVSSGNLLVNYDLHYGNVLAGEREPWLAIDPKVVVGDPEFGVAQLLWTRLDDMVGKRSLNRYFDMLVDLAALDPRRTRSWTLVRLVDYWLWGLSVGLTDDPARCAAMTDWLG